MGLCVVGLLVSLAGWAHAQITPAVAARQWRELNERRVLDELVELLRIPNTGQDAAAMRRNADAIVRMLARRGVRARLLEVEGAPPVVYGERLRRGARQTLLFYSHYDGRPVNPSEWNTGDPFRPTLMSDSIEAGGQPIPLPRPGWPSDPEWRLYARSASDAKSSLVALACALEALDSRQVAIPSNLKFVLEGEKESMSQHLAATLKAHPETLRGDVWFVMDGAVHPNRQQQLAFGLRGLARLDITVYGARYPLPGRQYADWAPNPALVLGQLLASFKTPDGKVAVEGFYNGIVPLGEAELRAIDEAPDYAASLRRELWLSDTAAAGRLEAALNEPGLSIGALKAGAADEEGRGMIPSSATASLDVWLVKGMDHVATVERILSHIRKQGFIVTESEPGEEVRARHANVCKVSRRTGYNAVRVSLDSDLCQHVIQAVEQGRGPVIKLPVAAADLPVHHLQRALNAPAIIVPIANHDGNAHGPNENIRLQNLWDGIETMAALIALDEPEPAPRSRPSRRIPAR